MSKTIKRLTALMSVLVVFLSSFGTSALTDDNGNTFDYNSYPVVLVPGYASASLCYDEGGETKTAWGWEISDLTPGVADNIVELIRGIIRVSLGDSEYLPKAVGETLTDMFEPMRCNPDSTSVKNVRPVLFNAWETCDEYMNENYPDGDYRVELDMTGALDELIGEENVFYFNCDFRMSAKVCAQTLDIYIEQVLDYTKAQKVNIVAVSHGGLITSAYLDLYKDKQQVYNVVMDEPALAGAELAADFMNGEISLDEESLVKYLEYHAQCETDFNWLLKAQQLGALDGAIETVLPYAREAVKYWGSLWDLIPPDEYDKLKEKYLDKDESADLIAQSDYVHYQLMPNYRQLFESAKNLGINVSIIAGSGHSVLTGTAQNSDGIIALKSSTGATCAPVGKRFADGYTQKEESAQRLISPSMDIDASTCYLPYNTWIVDGLYHGMEFWDEYTRGLLFTLLLTDEPFDNTSDPDYPMFKDTTSVTSSVYFAFNKSFSGYADCDDTSLIITNLSKKYDMYILNIKCCGFSADFDYEFRAVPPGESIEVPFDAILPEGVTYSEITVTYVLAGSVTPLAQRTQPFTILNGRESTAADGFVEKGFETDFERRAGKKLLTVLDKIGAKDFVSTVYDAASSKWSVLIDAIGSSH